MIAAMTPPPPSWSAYPSTWPTSWARTVRRSVCPTPRLSPREDRARHPVPAAVGSTRTSDPIVTASRRLGRSASTKRMSLEARSLHNDWAVTAAASSSAWVNGTPFAADRGPSTTAVAYSGDSAPATFGAVLATPSPRADSRATSPSLHQTSRCLGEVDIHGLGRSVLSRRQGSLELRRHDCFEVLSKQLIHRRLVDAGRVRAEGTDNVREYQGELLSGDPHRDCRPLRSDERDCQATIDEAMTGARRRGRLGPRPVGRSICRLGRNHAEEQNEPEQRRDCAHEKSVTPPCNHFSSPRSPDSVQNGLLRHFGTIKPF